MKELQNIFLVEWLKIKGTKAIAATVIAPSFVSFIALMIHLNHPERLIEAKISPWIIVFQIASLWGLLLSPLLISLVTYLVNNVEHKAEAWKHIYTLPVPRWKLYLGKMFICLTLGIISLLILYILLYTVSAIIYSFYPEVPFLRYNPHYKIFIIFIKIFFASLFIVQLQFLVSNTFNNFMIPLGLAVLATFSTIALQSWKHIHYFPYAYTSVVIKNLFQGNGNFWQIELVLSIFLGTALLIASLLWNKKKGGCPR